MAKFGKKYVEAAKKVDRTKNLFSSRGSKISKRNKHR